MTHVLPCLKKHALLLAGLLLFFLSGCSSTKSVPDGDALFAGFTIKVEGPENKKRRKELVTEMGTAVRPQPNASIFGLRPKVWFYHAMGTPKKEKGIRHWLKTKLGAAPVLYSEVDTGNVSTTISKRLHNRGYFNNRVTSTTSIKKKKATVTWTAMVNTAFKIRSLQYPIADSLPIHQQLRDLQASSLLKVGEPYNLQTMIAERERLDEALKNRGFFHFNPDFLIFRVDSTVGTKEVDVLLRIKPEAPAKALIPYTIDDVYVFAKFSLSDSLYNADTVRFENYFYIPDENYVRARHLMPSVFLEKGKLYARQDHLLTVRRLMGLGVYKYANIRYDEDTVETGKMDAFIYLTPALKKSLRLEAQMVSKSNNLAGPGLTASFRNRNAFKGSELLTINLIGNYENQIGGQAKESRTPLGLSSYELGVRTDLTLPRFITPFKVKNLRSASVPNTRISLGYSYLSRVEFFSMNSYTGSYSYNWKPRLPVTYEVTPINLQFVKLFRTTEAFDSVLTSNQFLRRSFEQQFILGTILQHTFDNRVYPNRKTNLYNRFNIDLSGNAANAIKTLLGADKPTAENPRTVITQPFSQYTRLENDFRYYYNLSKRSMIATRFISGVGFAYGNSQTMPYVKQFSIGGPNSIRAFRARSLGPGTYDIPDELAFSFFDQTGDVKLEANIEYRFPISGWFRGALFIDAGNIWLVEESEARPGGEFKANRFFNELAVGTGFGLRVDVEFFVIRFDFGIPVRVPSDSNDQQNVLPDFRPGLGNNGMILNIAIGYPF